MPLLEEYYSDSEGQYTQRPLPVDYSAPTAPGGESWQDFIQKTYASITRPFTYDGSQYAYPEGDDPYADYGPYWTDLAHKIVGHGGQAYTRSPELLQAIQSLPPDVLNQAGANVEAYNRPDEGFLGGSPLGDQFFSALAALAIAGGGAAAYGGFAAPVEAGAAVPAGTAGTAGVAGVGEGTLAATLPAAGEVAGTVGPAAGGIGAGGAATTGPAASTLTTLAPVTVTAAAPGLTVPEALLIGGGVAGAGAGGIAALGGSSGGASVTPTGSAAEAQPADISSAPPAEGGRSLTVRDVARLGQAGLQGAGALSGGGGGDGNELSTLDEADQEALLQQVRQLGLATGRQRGALADEARIRQQAQANASQQELLATLRPQIQQIRQRLQGLFRGASRLGPGGGGQVERAERQALSEAGGALQARLAAAPGTGLGNLLAASQGFRPFTLAQLPQPVTAVQTNPAQFGDVAGATRGIGQLYDAFAPAPTSSQAQAQAAVQGFRDQGYTQGLA